MKTISKILFLCGIILITAISCEEKDNKERYPCGIENPQENIAWLKNILDRCFYAEIYTIFYEGKEYICVCDPPDAADGMIIFYDCQGNKICEWGGIFAGSYDCYLPSGLTWEYYEENKQFIYKHVNYP